METVTAWVKARVIAALLTSSEVELMETFCLLSVSVSKERLLTSSEVELMETSSNQGSHQENYLLTSSEVELMETLALF